MGLKEKVMFTIAAHPKAVAIGIGIGIAAAIMGIGLSDIGSHSAYALGGRCSGCWDM